LSIPAQEQKSEKEESEKREAVVRYTNSDAVIVRQAHQPLTAEKTIPPNSHNVGIHPDDQKPTANTQYLTPVLKADKESGKIIIDEVTTISGIPKEAWEYQLGNKSALEWILDQYKERKPTDVTIAEKFNTYKFADYKETVIDLIQRVCTVSVETVRIMKEMEKE